MRAGLDAAAYCDNHMQAISASHLTKNDVAIGISHSGSSKDIVDMMGDLPKFVIQIVVAPDSLESFSA